MAKVVPFTTVRRKNLAHKEKPDLYYARAKSSRYVDIDELSERIQRSCTVNGADVVAVLYALQDEMAECFKYGEMVHLGKIGSFQVTLASTGMENEKDVKEHVIRGARICFRPGAEIKAVLNTLIFSKLKAEGEKEPEEKPDPDPDPEAPDPSA